MKKAGIPGPKNLFLILCLSTLALLIGTCGFGPEDGPGNGLNIISQSPSEIGGEYHHSEGSITFFAASESDSIYRLSLRIHDKEFEVMLEERGEDDLHLAVDGHGHSYSSDDIEMLRTFGLEFRERTESGRDLSALPVHVQMVVATIAYLSAFPEGYVHEARVRTIEREWITCVYKGDWLEATFTDFWGTTYHVWDEVGLYGGRGRCGDDWFATGWTLDCFHHDECEIYMDTHGIFELPGGLGPNCLDEFFRAIDDFIFSLLLGCTG